MKSVFIFISVLIFSFNALSQTAAEDTSKTFQGISVAPSSLYLTLKPGSTVIKEVTINNNSKLSHKFNIGYNDFEMGQNGKPIEIKSKDSKFALSKWITAMPNYFEVKSGETKKIKLSISIPDTAFFSAWTILTIDEITERSFLDQEGTDKTVSLGVIPSVGFGIYIFQNPPNVKNNVVEIEKFSLNSENDGKKIFMSVLNKGEGIGYSTAYVELTNLNLGKTFKLASKRFVILPAYTRDLIFLVPTDIPIGKYSGVGILDFGSKDDIRAAEIEFEIL